MHDSRIELNNGEVQVCPLLKWRPEEGWVQLFDNDPVRFTDIAGGYIGGGRMRLPDGRVASTVTDIFVKAVEDGWDGS